jgi:hypothetical protein
MKTCPTCQSEAAVIIVNVKTGREHCHACIGGTFMRWYVLTPEDVRWMRECGINPEVTAIEDYIERRNTSRH